jgi:hypothetical protein
LRAATTPPVGFPPATPSTSTATASSPTPPTSTTSSASSPAALQHPTCGDIDFNNDGLFPDTLDIDSLLSVFSGGPADSNAGKDGTGISLLDDATDDSDANAVTRITTSPGALVDPGEDKRSASGSGGLLDLTREADDTSLGAGLLEDVYGGETVAAQTAATDSPSDGGALFESPAGASDFESSAPVAAVAAAEVYDGPGSGLVGGLALGAIVALGVAAFTLIMGMTGSGGGMIKTIGDNFMILIGVAAGVSLIAAVVGWLLGKKS